MAARKSSIEFLPQESWEKGTGGRLLKWALTVGRHVVIFTELIVILAFLSRFKFDRDLTDINEEIKQKQAIVTNSAKFEQEFRLLQSRLVRIEQQKNIQPETDLIVDAVASLLPIDVYLSDLTVANQQITLNAVALSETGLAGLANNLKTSGKFSKPLISQIYYGGDSDIGIKFQIKTEFIKNGT
jgi:Tfp pilus assembly protein PilN